MSGPGRFAEIIGLVRRIRREDGWYGIGVVGAGSPHCGTAEKEGRSIFPFAVYRRSYSVLVDVDGFATEWPPSPNDVVVIQRRELIERMMS